MKKPANLPVDTEGHPVDTEGHPVDTEGRPVDTPGPATDLARIDRAVDAYMGPLVISGIDKLQRPWRGPYRARVYAMLSAVGAL